MSHESCMREECGVLWYGIALQTLGLTQGERCGHKGIDVLRAMCLYVDPES